MPRITIDDKTIDVAEGTTVLEAARLVGLEIPTLCFLDGYEPSTSCQVCQVKDRGTGRWLPSCATHVQDGMQVESETDEVHAMRRTALELLFSDHVGDCLAPCFFACPAHMDIPLMLQQIGEHDVDRAIATIKEDIALPAVLGRVCSKPCEKGCRRTAADGAVAVCELKRFVADADLARPEPYRPPCKPSTGRRVCIIGAGPTGLSAAYYLVQEGHACVLLEKEALAGGLLRTEVAEEELPRSTLDAEIQQVLRLGVELKTEYELESIDEALEQFDAVLVACGQVAPELLRRWGLETTSRGVAIDKHSFLTNRSHVFAAGRVHRQKGIFVRSVADGKLVARAIGEYLSGEPITPPAKTFSSRIGTLQEHEVEQLAAISGHAQRDEPDVGADFSSDEAALQSDRCFACGCVSHGTCSLERYAVQYHADPTRFAGERKPVEVIDRPGGIRFEPNKCIKCELCIQIATRHGAPRGLSFVGRGFDVRVASPFGADLEDALGETATEVVAGCPTGALSFSRLKGCE